MILELCCFLFLIPFFIWYIYLPHRLSQSPFSRNLPSVKGHSPTFDHKERAKVLKQGFNICKVPPELDVIVIGSGLGGLATAATLARAGKKVLVLEQHDQAGGCCHSFVEKGYEFDAGIHYVGEMNRNTLLHEYSNQISDGQLEWKEIEDEYCETVVVDNPRCSRRYYTKYERSSVDVFRNQLVTNFPSDAMAIDIYIADVKSINYRFSLSMAFIKHIPKWLCYFLIRHNILNSLTSIFVDSQKSLKTYMEELTENEDLRMTLCYWFGDYNTLPENVPWTFHVKVCHHYWQGASYPKWGSSQIAYTIIPVIESSGGRVLVRAPVKSIVIRNGSAIGVTVVKNGTTYEMYAPKIVSAVGVANTCLSLLEPQIATKLGVYKTLQVVEPGWAAVSLFVGIKHSNKELKLPSGNFRVLSDVNFNDAYVEFLNSPDLESALEKPLPYLFMSFPSAKDPEWESKSRGTTVCTGLCMVKYEWFEEWQDERVLKRGVDYDHLKKKLGMKMWDRVTTVFPQLKDVEIEYFDVGSPLSNNHYLASHKGEIYGLDHGLERFKPEHQMHLRPTTEIPGLFLTGQDIMVVGVAGALFSAMITSSVLLDRALIVDLYEICLERHRNSNKYNKLR